MPERVPPGRAGRLWLLGRVASARRSVELLDRKRKLLQREDARLTELCEQTRMRCASDPPAAASHARQPDGLSTPTREIASKARRCDVPHKARSSDAKRRFCEVQSRTPRLFV